MPAGGIHLCVAKSVAGRMGLSSSMRFLIGSVAPDSWRNSLSTKQQTHFSDGSNYDYEFFSQKYKSILDDDFVLGYLVHLMTDKYWHGNNFLTTMVSNDEYGDLNRACSELVSRYGVGRLHLSGDFVNPIEELDSSGIDKTISYLNSVNYLGDTESVFDVDELVLCVEETSLFVVGELSKLHSKGMEKIKEV